MRRDKSPRAVIVTRPTPYEMLIAQHATRDQAKFVLRERAEDIDGVEAEHHKFEQVLERVMKCVPLKWRRNRIDRDELDRFLFEPDDRVIVVGQDGLVANVAKYLNGQFVLGVNPDRDKFDGVLVPLCADDVKRTGAFDLSASPSIEKRTMAKARLDDGQVLFALNEIFIGHQSHQSARYRIRARGAEERQSSSGIVVTTGTGATGWARSICRSRGNTIDLPRPADPRLTYLVREAFPSVTTGVTLTDGGIAQSETLEVVSEMNGGGVVFGDGIEADHIDFGWGRSLRIGVSDRVLNLVQV